MENENQHELHHTSQPSFFHKGKPRVLLVLGGSLFLGLLMLAAFYFGTLYGKAQTIIKESNSWVAEGSQKPSKPMPKPLPSDSNTDYIGWKTYEGNYVSFKYPEKLTIETMVNGKVVEEVTLNDENSQQILDIAVISQDNLGNVEPADIAFYKSLGYKDSGIEPKKYNGTEWTILSGDGKNLYSSSLYGNNRAFKTPVYLFHSQVGMNVYVFKISAVNGWMPTDSNVEKLFSSVEFVF